MQVIFESQTWRRSHAVAAPQWSWKDSTSYPPKEFEAIDFFLWSWETTKKHWISIFYILLYSIAVFPHFYSRKKKIVKRMPQRQCEIPAGENSTKYLSLRTMLGKLKHLSWGWNSLCNEMSQCLMVNIINKISTKKSTVETTITKAEGFKEEFYLDSRILWLYLSILLIAFVACFLWKLMF